MDFTEALRPDPLTRGSSVKEDLPLSSFLEKIIDKKVHQTALTIFESFIDMFCYCVYTPYFQRLAFRLSHLERKKSPETKAPLTDPIADLTRTSMPGTAEKVHYFADGTPLVDRTSGLRVKIEKTKIVKLTKLLEGRGEEVEGPEKITVDGKKVYFHPDPKVPTLWGKAFGTDHVIATDLKEFPEFVILYTRETDGNSKVWYVNTKQPVIETAKKGDLIFGKKEVFVAQSLTSLRRPTPITTSFLDS